MNADRDGDRGPLAGTHAQPAGAARSLAAAELGQGAAEDLQLVTGDARPSDPRRVPDRAARGVAISPQRVRGRPQGARNIRDTAVVEALAAKYGEPLEADWAIGTMAPGDLVTLLRTIASDRGIKLGLTLGDVLALQRECRKQAERYAYAPRAAVDQKGSPVVPVIGIGRVEIHQSGGGSGRSIEDVIEAQAVEIVEQSQEDSNADGE